MKLLFCAYRDWATDVYLNLLFQLNEKHEIKLIKTPHELIELTKSQKWDCICVVGWSWLVPADIVNDNIVIGMHPSDLPHYAGGSPIQNQVLDGVENTNATLFRLNEKFDEGMIVDKEPISLVGHLDDIFQSISAASVKMIARFINNYPNNSYTKQQGQGKKVKRLKPEDSRLPLPCQTTEIDFKDYANVVIVKNKLTCKELWDKIRCRENPYPNAYFEDETGKLIIKHVEFEPKK